MRTLTRRLLATGAVAGLLALPVTSASAADSGSQTLTGQLGSEVSIDATPADVPNFTLPSPTGGESIGSISVSSNEAYTLSVSSNYNTMTGWDSANGLYDEGRALTAQMNLLAVADAANSTATATGATAVVGTGGSPLATNALSNLVAGTDVYDLTATQAAGIGDPAGEYRIELTYTITATL